MLNLKSFDYDQFSTDSEMLNAAVRASAERNMVTVPPINPRNGSQAYIIDESILLPSNFTLVLDNCHLKLSPNAMCNIIRNENLYRDGYNTLEGEQKNIRIIGKGNAVLDGEGHNDLFEWSSKKDGRPSVYVNNLILLHNVDGFEISGLTLKDQRWWALNLIFCSNGSVSDVTFKTDSLFSNQDGLNLRVGCHHVKLERLFGTSGDDFIALSAIGNPVDYLVDGKSTDIAFVDIKDVIASSMHEAIISLRANDTHNVHHINIENIMESNYGNENVLPYTTILLNQGAFYAKHPGLHGSMHHINIKNIYTKSGGTAITLGNTLVDSAIENVYASGSVNVLSTFSYDHFGPTRLVKRGDSDDPNFPEDGITLERVMFKNIVADKTVKGPAVDFSYMRNSDFVSETVIDGLFICGDWQTPRFAKGKEIAVINAAVTGTD